MIYTKPFKCLETWGLQALCLIQTLKTSKMNKAKWAGAGEGERERDVRASAGGTGQSGAIEKIVCEG